MIDGEWLDSIARIYVLDSGVIAGAGFLLDDEVLVTCAHVVAVARGQPKDRIEPVRKSVWVDVPRQVPGTPFKAKLMAWRPRGQDLALLRLPKPRGFRHSPSALRPIELPENIPQSLSGYPFEALGFPNGDPYGVVARGELGLTLLGDLIEMKSRKDEKESPFITYGFSGGPVRHASEGTLLGMVVERDPNEANLVARMLSLSAVMDALEETSARKPRKLKRLKVDDLARLPKKIVWIEGSDRKTPNWRIIDTFEMVLVTDPQTGYSFYLDVYPVTVYRYRRFKGPAARFPPGNRPKTCVTIREMEGFAQWAGKALPTWEEWRLASRFSQTRNEATGCDTPVDLTWVRANANFNGRCLTSVTRFPPHTTNGLRDLFGNAAEVVRNGPEYLRCGGAYQDPLERVRTEITEHGVPRYPYTYTDTPYHYIGFRCACSPRQLEDFVATGGHVYYAAHEGDA